LLRSRVLAVSWMKLSGVGCGLHDLRLARYGGTQLVKTTGGEHTIAGGLLDIALTGFLGEVSDVTGNGYGTSVRLGLAGQDPHGGGLTRTVSTHQPDAVTRLHTQVLAGGGQEGSRADAHF